MGRKVHLCPGESPVFLDSHDEANVAIGVKADTFAIEGFAVVTNYQAVCETTQILAELHGEYDLKLAANKCASSTACTHFTLSTVAGLEGMSPAHANTLWMCSGEPTLVYHAGWLSVAKPGVFPAHLQSEAPDA